MKALIFLGLLIALIFCISGAAIIGAIYSLDKGSAYLAYPDIIQENQNNVQFAVNNLISPMVFTSLLVAQTNLQYQYCDLPLTAPEFYSSFDYSPLISLQNALLDQNNTVMQSIGIISVQNAGTSSANFINKISCEISLNTFGLNCSDYIYACTNGTGFVGFCAYSDYTVDLNQLEYTGQDTGLVPTEIQLFNSKTYQAVFLPIFNLLGEFSLTYERAHRCFGNSMVYATSFAEKNLNELNGYLSTLTIGKTGVAYIVETNTGLLVSTSVNIPLVDVNNSRITPNQAQNKYIKQAADFLSTQGHLISFNSEAYFDPRHSNTGGLFIDVQPYEYPLSQANLGWLSVVAIPESDYSSHVSTNAKWIALVWALVSLVCEIILLVVLYCSLVIPAEDPSVPTFIWEIQKGRDKLLNR
jgi:hypothetical protein